MNTSDKLVKEFKNFKDTPEKIKERIRVANEIIKKIKEKGK